MKLKKLIIKNFQPFGESEQEIDLNTSSITLVTGFNQVTGSSNGSGKSSWIDALVWGLYGKTRGLADNVCNKYTGGKNTKVQVDFEKDGHLYEIIRYRKHTEQGNKLYIFKNKNDISYDSNKDTQLALDNILSISYSAFISSMVFEKDNYTPFLQSTPIKRLEIIENILLDISSVNSYYEQIKKVIKKAKESYKELEDSYKEYDWSMTNVDTTLEQYRDSAKRKIIEAKKKIKEQEKIKKKFSKIKDISTLIKNIEKKEKLEKEVKDLKENLTLFTKQKKSPAEFYLFEAEEVRKKISEYESSMADIKTNDGVCPTCHQPTTSDVIEKELKEIQEYIDDKNIQYEKIMDEMEEAQTSNKELQEKINDIIGKVKSKEDKLEKIPESDFEKEELENVKEKIDLADAEIVKQEEIIENAVDKEFIEEKLADKEASRVSKEKVANKIKVLEKEMKHLDYFYDLLGNKSGGFKKYLINKVLDILNNKINQFLSVYFPYDVEITFDASLNEKITVDKDKYSYGEFSSGEKMRIELSCVFALFYIIKAYIGQSSNILILDEILDLNLDSMGIKSTIGILNKLRDEGNSIFVISHKSDYNDSFPRKLKVIKEKNKKSRVNYG